MATETANLVMKLTDLSITPDDPPGPPIATGLTGEYSTFFPGAGHIGTGAEGHPAWLQQIHVHRVYRVTSAQGTWPDAYCIGVSPSGCSFLANPPK